MVSGWREGKEVLEVKRGNWLETIRRLLWVIDKCSYRRSYVVVEWEWGLSRRLIGG